MKQKSTKLLKKKTHQPLPAPRNTLPIRLSPPGRSKKALIFLEKQCKCKTNFIITFNC